MSSVYSGDPDTGPAAGDPAEITIPADGDALNAASVNSALEALADVASQLVRGPTTDAKPQFVTETAPATYKLLWTIKLTAGPIYARMYSSSVGPFFTVNAVYDAGGAVWNYDSGTKATRFVLQQDYLRWQRYAGATGWADGAWVSGLTWTSAVDLVSSVAITASAGDITSSAGNISGKQFISNSTIGSATKGAAMNNGGGDGSVIATGSDAKGLVAVVTGAAVNAADDQAVTVVSFGTAYSAAPVVVLYPTNKLTAQLANPPYIATTANDFTIYISSSPLTAGGSSYGWAYHVIG